MPRFLRLATQNWQLKLLAVALALFLWVVVSAEQVSTTWIDIPVSVQETDPDFQLIPSSVPQRVRVRFAGPGREFIDLAVRQPSLVLRIGEVEDVEQAFELTPSMVRLPDGLEVSAYDVDPAFARLRFVRLENRELTVGIAIDTARSREWTLTGPLRVTPSRVRISGPAESIPAVTRVSTVPLATPAREGPFDEEVALDLDHLPGVEVSARSVRVAGRVERVVTRRLPAVPVSVGPGIRIEPAEAAVQLRGGRSAVEGIAPDAFRVVLSLDSIPAQLPEGGLAVPLRVEGINPRVRATVEPGSVRLLPAEAPADSVAEPAEEVARPAPRPDAVAAP